MSTPSARLTEDGGQSGSNLARRHLEGVACGEDHQGDVLASGSRRARRDWVGGNQVAQVDIERLGEGERQLRATGVESPDELGVAVADGDATVAGVSLYRAL